MNPEYIDPTPCTALAAARAYEELHVPALFGPWAKVVAEGAGPGDRMLDVACGTGALARALAGRVSPGGWVIGLDQDAGMLEVAAQAAPSLTWRTGSAECLPFPDGAFDGVACQFGLMFFQDPPRALREMVRVLAPGGRLTVAVWDAVGHSPLFAVLDEIYERVLGEGAREALDAPFVLGDARLLASLLAGAGPGPVQVATRRVRACYPSADALVRADLEGWMPRAGIGLDADRARTILREARRALRAFTTPSGTVEGEVSAHIARLAKPSWNHPAP